MIIDCISDLHCSYPELEGGDLLIVSGDFTFTGTVQEISKFNYWLEYQKYKYKIVIAGNHDLMFEDDPGLARSLLTSATHYLNDDECEIEGLKFWGSPITPWFNDWAFNRYSWNIGRHWDWIPSKIDILITHGPPFGILDTMDGKHLGCPLLLEKVKKVKPKYHIFGHIHEGYGTYEEDGIKFINAALMNGQYKFVNKPIRIEL
jgi:Icc-related predicted phosphoesterase